MFSIVDFGLLISIAVGVYRLSLDFGLTPDLAALLLIGGTVYVVATNLMGSNVKRKNQPIKGLLALACFAWAFSGSNMSDAINIFVYGLALPIAMYGAYIFMKSPFVNR